MKSKLLCFLIVALVAAVLVSANVNLDDVVLFENAQLAPFQLQNLTWYDCPLFSASPFPIYENLTRKITEEEYHREVLDEIRKRMSGRHPLSAFDAPIPDFKTYQAAQGLEIRMAECSIVGLPLDYTNPQTSPRIPIFVKRLRQAAQAKKSLWLLQGGPGGSYTAFEKVMPVLHKLLSEFDIYTLDHRGVGYSSRLGCPASQAETTGSEGGVTITDNEMYLCGQELKNTYTTNQNKFSPTGAAWDLASLVATTNKLYGYDAHIYGVSYGTMWLNRFLQVSIANNWNTDKKLYKAIVLDGVVSTSSGDKNPDLPKRLQLSNWDVNMNAVGLYFIETYCNNNTICYEKLAVKTKTSVKTPVQVVEEVFESVYVNGTCKKVSSAISEQSLRFILGAFLMDMNTREFIPAIIYRLRRCDPDVDVPTLLHLGQVLQLADSQNATCAPLSSLVLQLNIMLAEIWPRDLELATYDKLYAIFNSTYIATGAYMTAKTLEVSQFPIYTPDEYFNKAPQPDVPTLLLNGDLDPQTPLQSAIDQLDNMGKQNTRLVTVTYAPHATVFRSPQVNSSIPCGMEIMASFLESNDYDLNNIDTSCLTRLQKINFTGSGLLNTLYFGVNDIYEDAYETPEVEKQVNLYLFIGVEAGTVVVSIIVVCCLIYYIVQLRDKTSEYEEIADR